MMSDYFRYEQEYINKYGPKTIFIMQCGSFFEVYGVKDRQGHFTKPQITEFSRICDMTIAKKKSTHKGQAVFMSGFSPVERLEKHVTKLNEAGYTVAVYVQDPNVPSIRSELGVYSPGTNFNMTSREISNNIMTLWIEKHNKSLLNKTPKIICGMSCTDVFTGASYIFEFKESYFHNPTTFDEIERFYTTYKPSEIAIVHNTTDEEIDDIIQFASIDCATIHKISLNDPEKSHYRAAKNCEKQTYQRELLERFYDISDYESFYESLRFRETPIATQSFCFLLDFVHAHNPALVKKIKEPVFNNVASRLVLGNHSLKQLNIVNTTNRRDHLSSVVAFVNKAKTPMGKRKISDLILNPTTDIEYLNKEYEIVAHTVEHCERLRDLRKTLVQIADFERLYRKIVLKRLVPSELSQFYKNLKTIMGIHKQLKAEENINQHINLPNLSKSCKNLTKYLKQKLNLSAASEISCASFETNIFKRGEYPELDALEHSCVDCGDKLECCRKFLEMHIAKFEKGRKRAVNIVKVHHTDKNGLFLTMTDCRSKILKKEIKPDIVSLKYDSTFDGTKCEMDFNSSTLTFSVGPSKTKRVDNGELLGIYTAILQSRSNLKEKLMGVYSEFIGSLQEYSEDISTIIQYVTRLDVLLTKMVLAKDNNYCRPCIDVEAKKSFLKAEEMRHLLIERFQKSEIYVPNDVELGETGMLLYGTNAVGKSSLIRSIGICVVLAQAGFFVPCRTFRYRPYTAIFTRILGNDNIFKGLSTFAVEMSELRTILRCAGENSLILGDELCSGTETTSAISIFAAGLVQLHAKGASFIFATHFHELTDMGIITDLERLRMYHMVVSYDRGRDILIYDRKLKEGPGNSMYGLEVCKALDLPQDFLELAHEIRKKRVPVEANTMEAAVSRYSAQKVKGNCEFCGKVGVEIHHLQPQEAANEDGFIGSFRKNHPANLANVCISCHREITRKNIKHRKTKTSRGNKFVICG